MRTKVIAGNWKMNNTIEESQALISALVATAPKNNATVVICPPFTSLALAAQLLKGSHIKLGAQDVSQHENGAYTGELSAAMLRSAGCAYVIVGHSERRQYHKESNDLINKKMRRVLEAGMVPIICVGETLQEREQNITDLVLTTQTSGVLAGLTPMEAEKVIVAYEPVWAIGTGKTATKEQAQQAHEVIRGVIARLISPDVAGKVVIQYGGSVKADNAKELLSQPDIDGALVGGACLKADSFNAIIAAA